MKTLHPEEPSPEQDIGIRWRKIAALILFAVVLPQMVGEVGGLHGNLFRSTWRACDTTFLLLSFHRRGELQHDKAPSVHK